MTINTQYLHKTKPLHYNYKHIYMKNYWAQAVKQCSKQATTSIIYVHNQAITT